MARRPTRTAKGSTEGTTPPEALGFKRAGSTGKATRVMSLSMIATYFDVSRNTVMRWIDDGCPLERKSSGKGDSHQMDVADVIRWCQSRAVASATGKAAGAASLPAPSGSGADGLETEDQAKARRARADADISEVKAAQALKSVTLIRAGTIDSDGVLVMFRAPIDLELVTGLPVLVDLLTAPGAGHGFFIEIHLNGALQGTITIDEETDSLSQPIAIAIAAGDLIVMRVTDAAYAGAASDLSVTVTLQPV